jgi:hypothetical protein
MLSDGGGGGDDGGGGGAGGGGLAAVVVPDGSEDRRGCPEIKIQKIQNNVMPNARIGHMQK